MEHNTVEHLQCVECTSFPLRLVADGGDEVQEGILVCMHCAQCYAVRDGIPSMVLPELRSNEELRIINEWLDRSSPDDRARAHARAERPGTGSAKTGRSMDKLREIDLRDRESRIYDDLYPDRKFEAELAIYDRLIRPDATTRLLDIGCGTGRVTLRYLRSASVVVGIDFSHESLLVFRNRIEPDLRSRVHLVRGDACNLPTRRGEFNCVIALGILYHLPGAEMRSRFLSEVVRSLGHGGAMIVTAYILSLVKRLRHLFGLTSSGKKTGYKPGGIYYYNHSPNELEAWLEHDFVITDLIGIDNRVPFVQHVSQRLSASIDRAITGTAMALPIFAREVAVRGEKR